MSLPLTHIRAAVAPQTFNDEEQTVDAIASTFADVVRRDRAGAYLERLDPAGLDMTSIVGVPLLDGHRQGSARDVLGIVKGARIEDGKLIVSLRLSQADDVAPVVTRIREGVLSLSIGYTVARWRDSTDPNQARVRTAAAWKIIEVSAVPVPADRGAQFRSAFMENEDIIENAGLTEEQATRIRSIGELADLPPSWAEDQIVAQATEADARRAAREAMIQRSASTPRIRVVASHDDPVQVRQRQEDALLFRAAGGELPEASRPFAEIGFRQLAVDSLARAGVSVRGLSTDEIFQRAAQHTTSDFSLTVANVAGRIAQERYQAAASGLLPLFRTRNLPNFKPASTVRLGEIGTLKELSESGEIQHVTHAESGESFALSTYAAGLNLSRRLLIDDDLGLFGDTTAALADAAAATVADKLAATLMAGNTLKLSDNKAVFHSTRGNLASSWGQILDLLHGIRADLRTVRGIDGKTIVGATPKYLVVGPELETAAEKALAEIYATAPADVNPFSGKLTLLVEPRIDDDQWYVFADPTRMPTLVLAYLSSAPGPQIQRTEGWDVLGMRFRVVLDFGVAWTDWRGAYSVPAGL